MSTSSKAGVGADVPLGCLPAAAVGVQACQSVASELSQAFTGSSTDRALWMVIDGVIATVAGGLYVFGTS